MKITFLNTISLTVLTLTLNAADVQAQLKPMQPKPSAAEAKPASTPPGAQPVMSLEELFGVSPKKTVQPQQNVTVPATAPATSPSEDSSLDSLKALFAEEPRQPAPIAVPSQPATVEIVEPSVPQPTVTEIIVPAESVTIVAPVTTETVSEKPPVAELSESMEEPVETVAEPLSAPAIETSTEPSTEQSIEPVETTVVESVAPPVEQSSEQSAPQPKKQTVRPKLNNTKPSVPGLLPSDLLVLEQALAQSIQPVEQLETVRQMPVTRFSEPTAGKLPSQISKTSIEESTKSVPVPIASNSSGSLNSLLSQQAVAINALDNDEISISVPTVSAVESVDIMRPQDQMTQNIAMSETEDPLAALSQAIEKAKQPSPSLSKPIVDQNPVNPAIDQHNIQLYLPNVSMPLEPVQAPALNAPVTNIEDDPLVLDQAPETMEIPEPVMQAPLAIVEQPATFDQPDMLQAPSQPVSLTDADSPLTPALPTETVSAKRTRVSIILFPSFQSRLTGASQNNIMALSKELRNSNAKIVLNGYADWTSNGSMDATIYLSNRRAETVKEAMVAAGVNENRIVVQGKGLDLRGGLSKDRVDVVLAD